MKPIRICPICKNPCPLNQMTIDVFRGETLCDSCAEQRREAIRRDNWGRAVETPEDKAQSKEVR